MDRIEHKRSFDEAYAALKRPRDYSEVFPPTYFPFPSVYAWKFKWVIKFEDKRYIQIRELHVRVKGLQESRRVMFAYHYGPVVKLDRDGLPEHTPSDPVDIRIDDSNQPAHLHYGAPNPHHLQENVKGLVLADLDMFKFLKAVLRHRKNKKPINVTMGFKIR